MQAHLPTLQKNFNSNKHLLSSNVTILKPTIKVLLGIVAFQEVSQQAFAKHLRIQGRRVIQTALPQRPHRVPGRLCLSTLWIQN